VVLQAVLHRKGLGEGPAEARDQPVRVVADLAWLALLRLDEVLEDLHHQVGGQAVQVALHGVLDPVALPVVVHARGQRLVALLHAGGEELLDALDLGEGDVRTLVEEEALPVAVRGGMPAVIGVLLENDGLYGLVVEPVRRTETGHPRTQDRNLCHLSSLAPVVSCSAHQRIVSPSPASRS
jgi:hypothetical protein